MTKTPAGPMTKWSMLALVPETLRSWRAWISATTTRAFAGSCSLAHRSGRRKSDLAAAPRDEACRDDVERGGGDVAVHAEEEELRGERPDGARILGDHSHGRLQHVCEQDVVEADQRDLVLGAGRTKRSDRADGDEVLACEERGRRGGRGEQLGDRGLGGFAVLEVVAHDGRVDGDAGGLESPDVAGVPLPRGIDGREVAE